MRTPYANSLCAQDTDKFCVFHVISVEFYNSANEMQGLRLDVYILKLNYSIKNQLWDRKPKIYR